MKVSTARESAENGQCLNCFYEKLLAAPGSHHRSKGL